MKPKIGISDKNLQSVADILSNVLADGVMVYTKTRKFHWNVNGESFMEIHKLFESHYKQIEEAIDEVAERISKLGSPVIGTMKEYLKFTKIKEDAGKYPSRAEMITELLNDHETIIKAIRKGIDDCDKKYSDVGTADFLTGLMEQHETIAWTLRRYMN